MDAIEYLTYQHHEIESVFDQLETALRAKTKRRLCRKLADLLAVHTAIEEGIFYPAARDAGIRELLPGALEEHLSAESIIAEVVAMHEVNERAMAKISALKEWKMHHADEEEKKLFPRARELLTPFQLDLLGRRMESMAEQMMGADSRARDAAPTALA